VVDVTLAHLANAPAKALGGLVVGGWSGGGMVGAKAAELFVQRGIQVHLVGFISAVPDSNQVGAFVLSYLRAVGVVCFAVAAADSLLGLARPHRQILGRPGK
jgi:hypothetical protein